jgi:hypothetical protein
MTSDAGIVAAQVAVLAKLASTGLYRRYPRFAVFLLADIWAAGLVWLQAYSLWSIVDFVAVLPLMAFAAVEAWARAMQALSTWAPFGRPSEPRLIAGCGLMLGMVVAAVAMISGYQPQYNARAVEPISEYLHIVFGVGLLCVGFYQWIRPAAVESRSDVPHVWLLASLFLIRSFVNAVGGIGSDDLEKWAILHGAYRAAKVCLLVFWVFILRRR